MIQPHILGISTKDMFFSKIRRKVRTAAGSQNLPSVCKGITGSFYLCSSNINLFGKVTFKHDFGNPKRPATDHGRLTPNPIRT